MKVGSILKACRERQGYSQEELAKKLNRSRSCISKFENDLKTLDLQTFMQWMEITNAKEVMIAFFCGMDGIQIMQNLLTMFIGG